MVNVSVNDVVNVRASCLSLYICMSPEVDFYACKFCSVCLC